MRTLLPFCIALAACQPSSPDPTVARAAAVPEPVPCTRAALFDAGAAARRYPRACEGQPDLFEAYRLGRQTFTLEEELREVNYRIASADGRGPIGAISTPRWYGFGSRGYLIGRRVELKNAIRALRRQAGAVE